MTEGRQRDNQDQDPPDFRQLAQWSTEDGWVVKATLFDAQVARRVESEISESRIEESVRRSEERLSKAAAFKHILTTALMVHEPVLDSRGRHIIGPDGQPVYRERVRTFDEFETGQISAMIQLHKAVEHTERLEDGLMTDRVSRNSCSSESAEGTKSVQVGVLPEEERERLWRFLNPPPEIVGRDAPSLAQLAHENIPTETIIDAETGIVLKL